MSRTEREGETSSFENFPSSPAAPPGLAVPAEGQRTPEPLSARDHRPVEESTSTASDGLSRRTMSPRAAGAAPAVRRKMIRYEGTTDLALGRMAEPLALIDDVTPGKPTQHGNQSDRRPP
jgi:hypothetical protein